MSDDLTTDWIADGHVLHLGEPGPATWQVKLPGLADVVQRLAQAHNEAMGALRRRAEQAEAERDQATAATLAYGQAHAEAWRLIGRCDLSFELIANAQSLRATKKAARRMRAEIVAATASSTKESEGS